MKRRIPKFKSLEDERQFWQTHDVTEWWQELRPITVRFAKPHRTLQLTTQELRTLQGLLTKLLTHTPSTSHRKS